jgi:hypothetical protein
LQRAFALGILMVHSSALIVSTDGERLTCGGFSLSEIVHFGSLEFIADCFSGLSLSPMRNDSGITFMGSTHCGPPSPLRAMLEDSVEEFYMTSSRGGLRPPLFQEARYGDSVCPVATTPWLEDTLITQDMTTVPPWVQAPQPDIGLLNVA